MIQQGTAAFIRGSLGDAWRKYLKKTDKLAVTVPVRHSGGGGGKQPSRGQWLTNRAGRDEKIQSLTGVILSWGEGIYPLIYLCWHYMSQITDTCSLQPCSVSKVTQVNKSRGHRSFVKNREKEEGADRSSLKFSTAHTLPVNCHSPLWHLSLGPSFAAPLLSVTKSYNSKCCISVPETRTRNRMVRTQLGGKQKLPLTNTKNRPHHHGVTAAPTVSGASPLPGVTWSPITPH